MPLIGTIVDLDEERGRKRGHVTSMDFLYFGPITNNVAAEYSEEPVRGRSEPHPFYSGTGEDTYSFSIKLMASVDQGDGGTPLKAWNSYLYLKSFQFPDYGENNQGPIRPPRQCIISIGKLFRKRGIIKQPSFSFNPPYDADGYPHSIDCSFTFRVFNEVARSYTDILSRLPSV